jgi:hypothetical protein
VKPLTKENGVDSGVLRKQKLNSNGPLSIPPRTDTLRIATLNIDGLSSVTRQAMLENYPPT